MRLVVLGAGAIGGVVGARLALAGHDVTLVARGDHAAAIAAGGLVLESPSGTVAVAVRVVTGVAAFDWDRPATVLLAVKGQDTAGVLDELAAVAPPETAVACLQNGVDNERQALRRFPAVYGVWVVCPATHLRPGVVLAHSGPVPGLLDLGRYPAGVDGTAVELAAALASAGFVSVPRPDIMRFKYAKLLANLSNAPEALCGPAARSGELADLARHEGEAVLAAAGIEVASPGEERARRDGAGLSMAATASGGWQGGSTWQSVERGAGSVEVDYLNGEISLLGRLAGMPTPVNDVVVRQTRDLIRRGEPAGSVPADEVLAAAAGALALAGPFPAGDAGPGPVSAGTGSTDGGRCR